ncbi:MAG: MoxR family ATPase [Oscillospiraceae bacterium]|nr:MoxR family ATPase [Oscillospiraceae bacterium]
MQTKEQLVTGYAQQILNQVRRVVVGKDTTLLWVLAAILARGHILLEDIPGVGKTTMALAFSKVLNLGYSRVQFTPDVLPSDVTGYSVLDQASGKMHYQPGAVLCNLFLADELNRATSRTQSALLEAMEEGQVTVDGVSHPLPQPFVVIATQNPTGAAGTQLLPDSQMDRFTVRLSLGYPSPRDEVAMVLNRQGGNPLQALQPLLTRENLVAMQDTVAETYIGDAVVNYIVELIVATRNHADILRGASPRATLAVTAMAKAVAQLRGRDYVIPADVREVFTHTVAHRLLLSSRAEGQGRSAEQVLSEILNQVAPPRLR